VPPIIQGMRDLLARGQDLPTLPMVVFQLHGVLDDERAGPGAVAEVITRDPALAARLLKTANSAAFFRGGEPIGSVFSAVQRLGVRQVRAICIALAVVRAFSGKGRGQGLNHERLWTHSAVVGLLARQLWAEFGRAPSISSDDAYVAGLLHDCGLLILDQFFARDFTEARQLQILTGLPLWQCEEEQLGMNHAAVGGLLLGRWSLPQAIAEAVSCHHHPAEASEEYRELARVIHAAEILASHETTRLTAEVPPDAPAAQALAALGASPAEIAQVIAEVPRVAEWASGFLD
jgi:HD-like signal output (HDOD) protein